MRREIGAILIAAAVACLVLIAMLTVDIGSPTAPDKRAQEQNAGSNAPQETLSPAGTYKEGVNTEMTKEGTP